jgi:hypothetical protein
MIQRIGETKRLPSSSTCSCLPARRNRCSRSKFRKSTDLSYGKQADKESRCAKAGARNSRDHIVHRQRLSVLAALALTLFARQALAGSIGAQEAAAQVARCQSAIVRASDQTGVPARLLRALAPTESGIVNRGGRHLAWPWTLNTNGYGSYHFRSRVAAESHLMTLLADGIDNIDVGCMQINWHWHHADLASLGSLMDPDNNALYAALLLRTYRKQTGSWSGAVGLYHTHNPMLAARYQCRVARELVPGAAIQGCE